MTASAPNRRRQERSDRFIVAVSAVSGGPPRENEIHHHSEFGGSREEAVRGEREEARRNAEHGRLRQGIERPGSEDVGRAGWERRDEPSAQAELVAQRDGCWLLHEQRIWTGVDREPIGVLRQDDPAGA